MPFLSVILRVHRRPNRLKKTLESILPQTFKDYELIIITDDPTDTKSMNVVQSFIPRFPAVRFLSVEPLGWPGCNQYLDKGAQEARGEWIVYIDDDDMYIDPRYFQTIFDIQQRKPHIKIILSQFTYPIPFGGANVIPPYILWGKPPQMSHIGTPNLCVRTSFAREHSWAPTPTGDFEFISACYRDCDYSEVHWNDKIVVSTQSTPSFGSTDY